MPSSYNATLFSDILLDTAVLKADLTTPGTMETIGGTRGGISFDPGITFRNVEYDGKRSEHIIGGGRIMSYAPVFTGTLIVFNAKVLRFLLPGGVGTLEVITPLEAGTSIPLAAYHKWSVLWSKGTTGGTLEVTFPYGIVTNFSIGSTDNSEGENQITIAAAQRRDDAASTDGEVPFTIVHTPGV